jgi:hypothetical protein
MKLLSQIIAIAAVLVGLAGLALDFYEIIPGVMSVTDTNPVARNFFDTQIYFWTFFTHLTNLVLVLIYLAELTQASALSWFRNSTFQASMAANITLVMVFFHVMLAPQYHFEGPIAVANVLLHYVAPILYLIWWVAFGRRGTLRFISIPLMLAFGLVYLAWALIRGALTGEYPYAILDPTIQLPNGSVTGYIGVAIGTGIIIAAVAAFCVLIVALDKALGPPRAAIA